MSCARLERRVSLWVGGELSPRRAARIAAHVAGCERCRGLADRLHADRSLVAEVTGAPPPPETLVALRKGVLARLTSEALAPRPPVQPIAERVRWASALAAAVLVLAAVGLVMVRRGAHAPAGLIATAPAPLPASSGAAGMPAAGPASPSGRFPEAAPASAGEVVEATEGRRPVSRGVVRPQPSPRREATAEVLVIKLLTDDPDVVIYWLVDQQKG